MRRVSLFLLFLLVGSLLAAAPVRAETAYYALSFDGEDDYVIDSDFPALTGQFSVVVLAKWNGGGDDYQRIVSSERWTDADGNGANERWGVLMNIYNNSVRIVRVVNGSSETTEAPIGPHKVFLAAGVYDGSELRIYLNSTLISSVADTRQMYDYGGGLALGKKFYEDLAYFDGTIYLVLIYNKALSDSEIQAIYADPLNPPTDGLVLEYLPSSVDTVNGLWKDLSGNANDGQIYGASYVPLRPISEALSDEARALSFDGQDDYMKAAFSSPVNTTALTLIAFAKDNDYSAWTALVSGRLSTYPSTKNSFELFSSRDVPKEYVLVGNSSGWFFGEYTLNEYSERGVIMYSAVYSACSGFLYINAKEYGGKNTISCSGEPDVVFDQVVVGAQSNNLAYKFNGTIYEILIYSRALSDEEIRQIYENPLDPPKRGLVLFYSPYSYDPESGRWLNIAPIFPTIPLAEELDAVNYGATPERVSIPSLSVYDAQNGTPISPLNVSLSMLYNNTTTGLIPTLPVLPYNETVTLNVSATGYYERLITTWTGIDSLAVYLQPMPGDNTTSNLNPPNWTVNYTVEEINGTGWSGWQVGKAFLELKLDKAVELFFTENPNSKAEVIVPFVVWIGFTIAALVFSQSPGVAIVIGAVTQVSLAGMGAKLYMRLLPGAAVLYLFLFIWVLKDFIETFRKD